MSTALQQLIPSQRLWHALSEAEHYAPRLYRRTRFGIKLLPEVGLSPVLRQRLLIVLGLLVVLYLLYRYGYISLVLLVIIVPMIPVILVTVAFLALFFFPIYQPLLLGLMGGVWASRISYELSKAQREHTYDLVSVLPRGELGAAWTIASACLRQGQIFALFRTSLIIILVLGGLLFLAQILIAINIFPGADQDDLRSMLDLLCLMLSLGMHHYQTLVLSALAGIATPQWMGHRLDAAWLAPVFLLALQFGSYLLFYVAQRLLSPLLERIPAEHWLLYLSVPLIYALIFIALREGLIVLLWQAVARHTNAGVAESWAVIER